MLRGFYTVRVKCISLRSRRLSYSLFSLTGRARGTREGERGPPDFV